jgi:WD40 repeat protein
MAGARSTASIAERTRALAADGPIVAAHFLGRAAVFVLGEATIVLVDPAGQQRRVAMHSGAILATAADDRRIVSGGDDGKVMATGADGVVHTLTTDAKRRWIDHVALGPEGTVSWSAGKAAFVQAKELRELEVASTVGGLAFFPKGLRLAVAHYNGATLWFPNAPQANPEKLEWKGSHLSVVVSPDGRFLITSMQDPMLHGWRVADRQHMRMSGYAARVTSLGFTASGRWLATSGAPQLVVWPFQSKDGPMGKPPRLLGSEATAQRKVEIIACNPHHEIVAAGYGDGTVRVVRIEDGAEILVRDPGPAAVSAMAWSADGALLGWGTEAGEAGIVDLG